MKKLQIHRIVLERKICTKSQRFVSADLYLQTQTTSFFSNPSTNNIETTESMPHDEATKSSIPTNSTLASDNNLPLQVPTDTIRSNSDIRIDPNKSETSASQENVTLHQCQMQNTATLSFPQFNRIQSNKPTYNPFTDFLNLFQNNAAVTNQPKRAFDHKFVLNTKTETDPTLS